MALKRCIKRQKFTSYYSLWEKQDLITPREKFIPKGQGGKEFKLYRLRIFAAHTTDSRMCFPSAELTHIFSGKGFLEKMSKLNPRFSSEGRDLVKKKGELLPGLTLSFSPQGELLACCGSQPEVWKAAGYGTVFTARCVGIKEILFGAPPFSFEGGTTQEVPRVFLLNRTLLRKAGGMFRLTFWSG
jgi:hypothetical protein